MVRGVVCLLSGLYLSGVVVGLWVCGVCLLTFNVSLVVWVCDHNAGATASPPPRNHVVPVHRLDKHTTGVLLCAKKPDVARFFAKDFEAHRVLKEYLAVVAGVPDFPTASRVRGVAQVEPLTPAADANDANDETQVAHDATEPADQEVAAANGAAAPGTANGPAEEAPVAASGVVGSPALRSYLIDVPLKKIMFPVTHSVVAPAGDAAGNGTRRQHAAQTWVSVLATNQARTHSLVVCSPLTGKTHQLRAHLAATGTPVLHDTLYADVRALRRASTADAAVSSTAIKAAAAQYVLHAWRMALPDPTRVDRRRTAFVLEAPPPPTFTQTLHTHGTTDLPRCS